MYCPTGGLRILLAANADSTHQTGKICTVQQVVCRFYWQLGRTVYSGSKVNIKRNHWCRHRGNMSSELLATL
jgi:hypothetical protein